MILSSTVAIGSRNERRAPRTAALVVGATFEGGHREQRQPSREGGSVLRSPAPATGPCTTPRCLRDRAGHLSRGQHGAPLPPGGPIRPVLGSSQRRARVGAAIPVTGARAVVAGSPLWPWAPSSRPAGLVTDGADLVSGRQALTSGPSFKGRGEGGVGMKAERPRRWAPAGQGPAASAGRHYVPGQSASDSTRVVASRCRRRRRTTCRVVRDGEQRTSCHDGDGAPERQVGVAGGRVRFFCIQTPSRPRP